MLSRKELIMMLKASAAVIAALCLTMPAAADEAPPDTANGRYIFNKIADGQGGGYLRLDTQTGEVAQCSQRSVGWACEAAPEDRAVFENEIARLRSENAALKKDILSRGLPLPPGAMPESVGQNGEPQNSMPNLRLPSDADVDRVMSFVGRVWRHFVDAIQRAQKQVLNKS
jgi:hypothetical protein